MHYQKPATIDKSRSAPSIRMPEFFIIGAAKCGTTTLYKYLCRHPQVFLSTPKEPSFFCDDKIYDRGIEWYGSLFADASYEQLCGEASTTYTRWPFYENTAQRLAEAQPDAKLIYLLRNPADRLYSFYGHRMRENVTTTFEKFMAETSEAVDSGRYMTQLNEYLRYFSREQILVLFTHDLKESPQQTLRDAAEFLGIDGFDFLQDGSVQANRGGGHHYAASSLTRTIQNLKRSPAIAGMLNRVPSSARRAGYRWLADGPLGKKLRSQHLRQLTPYTPALRKQLTEFYLPEIEALEAFTGRDLSEWKGDLA